jgi:DNA-binding CsgD family transcriptional regulator
MSAAQQAFMAGDVTSATTVLERAMESEPDAESLAFLGALYYLDDRFVDARRRWEEAFRRFRADGEPRSAVRVAVDLADLHASVFGNAATANGWLARARRLLERVGPCVEWGYYELAVIACERPDVDELARCADRALACAIEFDDADLEVQALAEGGLALICQGATQAGFERLDEALATISAGEVRHPRAVGRAFCAMLSSCDRSGDLRRAEEWIRLAGELILDHLEGRPRILSTHCRSAYGAVLCSSGRWPEAEEAILEVLSPSSSSSIAHRVDAVARLAELRLHQGKVEEAAQLIAPHEDRLAVWRPLAEVHLRRGAPELAAAVARRGLRELSGDALRRSPLLSLLVEAELCCGDRVAAGAAVAELVTSAERSDSAVLRAEAAIAEGRLRMAEGDAVAAVERFGEALGRIRDGERPLLAGVACLELARALAATGDEAAAVTEGRAALACFERLGAAGYSDRAAALLRGLGVAGRARPQQSREAALAALTSREGEVLDLVRAGESNAQIAARLFISPKTVEHHVGRILTKLGVRTRAEAAVAAAMVAAGERTSLHAGDE